MQPQLYLCTASGLNTFMWTETGTSSHVANNLQPITITQLCAAADTAIVCIAAVGRRHNP